MKANHIKPEYTLDNNGMYQHMEMNLGPTVFDVRSYARSGLTIIVGNNLCNEELTVKMCSCRFSVCKCVGTTFLGENYLSQWLLCLHKTLCFHQSEVLT